MVMSADGIQDVGGITVMKLARAKRRDPVIGSLVSEKLARLPSARIRSLGVLAMTAWTVVRVTMAVDVAQQVVLVGCAKNGIVWSIGL